MLAIIFAIPVTVLFIFLSKPNIHDFKNNLNKLIYSLIIFITTSVIVYIFFSKLPFFEKVFLTNAYLTYDKILLFLLSMSIAILLDGLFLPVIQKTYETIAITNYEKKHINENLQYYRELIKSESPSILAYCYKKKINVEDLIVATILHLKMQNIIILNENNIKVLKKTNELSRHEKYVLHSIKNSIDKNFKKEFKKKLLKDLTDTGYIERMNSEKIDVIFLMESFIAWMIIYLLVSLPIFWNLTTFPILAILAYVLPFISTPLFKSAYKKINPIVRTEKALDLCGKLKGLKNYIKDFSNIKDTGTEYINLYDEYVLYAIIFDIKGKLNNECKEIYKYFKNYSAK